MRFDKELFLHIGTNKTGTSSLQGLFHLNAEKLAEHGIHYPVTGRGAPGATQHHHLFAPICHVAPLAGVAADVPWEQGLDVLAGELAGRPEPRILLSTEMLSQGVDFDRLEALKALFARVVVVVYLRRQDHFVMSAYEQSVKSFGNYQPFDPASVEVPSYQAMLQPWNTFAGGAENVIVRPYERDQFFGGNIFDDFLHHVFGLPSADGFAPPSGAHGNHRLAPDALEFLRRLNAMAPPRAAGVFLGALYEYSDRAAPLLAEAFTQRDLLTRREARAIIDSRAEDNAAVAREYLGRDDGVLFQAALPEDTEEEGDRPPTLPPQRLLDAAEHIHGFFDTNEAIHRAVRIRALRLLARFLIRQREGPRGPDSGAGNCRELDTALAYRHRRLRDLIAYTLDGLDLEPVWRDDLDRVWRSLSHHGVLLAALEQHSAGFYGELVMLSKSVSHHGVMLANMEQAQAAREAAATVAPRLRPRRKPRLKRLRKVTHDQ